ATALREAHTLKGLAGNVGATELAQRAATLESNIKAGGPEARDTALAAVEESLVKLWDSLAASGRGGGQEPVATPNPSERVDLTTLAPRLDNLASLIANDDTR